MNVYKPGSPIRFAEALAMTIGLWANLLAGRCPCHVAYFSVFTPRVQMALSTSSNTTTRTKSSRELVQDALDANKKLQKILTRRAEQLEADLKEADDLLVSVQSFFGISFLLTRTVNIGCCEYR